MSDVRSIDSARICDANDAPVRSDRRYVLYWMHQAERVGANPALELAIERANELELPLVVCVGVDTSTPGVNLRSMAYRLDGLVDVAEGLDARGISFMVRHGSPPDVALAFAEEAALVVVDRGYLRHDRAWRSRVAYESPARVVQVEGEVVVPIDLVSDKQEYAARTIRPKLWHHVDRFLVASERLEVARPDRAVDVHDGLPRLDPRDPGATLARLTLDREVPIVAGVAGGERAAIARFDRFLDDRFVRYDDHRNQPQTDDVSHLSKALHFGHMSPVDAALRAREAAPDAENLDAFLEELIVRRELAINFVVHADDYDRYSALPAWARATLDEHRHDEREHLYDDDAFERAETHDPYWNAAMREMRSTGYMHNYMRMYWGKKILEWSASPEEAFERTQRLNDRWFLDGRDPNSYAGVAWCFGLHDRGWTERAVYGKVRYMNANGLKRKADPEAYVEKVDRLEREQSETDDASGTDGRADAG